MADYSPEKAGVSGSTPSLATTFQKLTNHRNSIVAAIGCKTAAGASLKH